MAQGGGASTLRFGNSGETTSTSATRTLVSRCTHARVGASAPSAATGVHAGPAGQTRACLLYTSDAADDM
eukprot:75833-Alexandrium_andersonii.AAC.1